MQPISSDEERELLALAIEKATDHVDDMFYRVLEYLEDLIEMDFLIPDETLRSIALEACRQVEKQQAAAVERSENT